MCDEKKDGNVEAHKINYTIHFYHLVTDFYEFGWDIPLWNLSQVEIVRVLHCTRHEMCLGHKLGLTDMRVLDVEGCGVGGPIGQLQDFLG